MLNLFSDITKIREYIDQQKLNEYIKFIVDSSFMSNKYFNDEAPWSHKDNIDRLNSIIYVSLELIRKISILLLPIIPETATKALKSLNIESGKVNFESISNHEILKPGTELNYQGILFKKIEIN